MRNARITRLFFVPTGSYHDMALRPYTLHANADDLEQLETATSGFRNVSVGALSGIAGNLLRPSTIDVGALSIDNGWNAQRYMYMMEVVYPNNSEYSEDNVATNVKYITGMTDRIGDLSFSGKLDPSMRMFIDKVIDTNETNTHRGVYRRPVSANRYLQQNAGQPRQRGNDAFFALRPRDVCAQIGNSGLGGYWVDSDYRTALSARPIFSNINNDLPTNYLNRTFEAYRTTINDVAMDPSNTDLPTLMSNVAGHTKDLNAVDDNFVTMLNRYTELSEGSTYSYGELCRLFEGVEQATWIADGADTLTEQIGFANHSPNDTEHWFGTKQETLIATIVSQAIQALMVGSLMTQVSFYVTNDTMNGETEFEFFSVPQSFILNGVPLNDHATYFRDRFVHEVFRSLTSNNSKCLTLSVFCDLAQSDTRIEVVFENGIPTPYCMPNFAGSLITPVIGNNSTQLDSLANNFHEVFDHMAGSTLEAPSNQDFSSSFRAGDTNLGAAIRSRTSSSTPSSGGGWKL
jgi:hypothetical protein